VYLFSCVQCLLGKLREIQMLNNAMHTLPGHTNVGIVIEGGALNGALAPNNQASLMELCKECKAVVCCRVTPMQKAQVRQGPCAMRCLPSAICLVVCVVQQSLHAGISSKGSALHSLMLQLL
jgi:hypothetical protein